MGVARECAGSISQKQLFAMDELLKTKRNFQAFVTTESDLDLYTQPSVDYHWQVSMDSRYSNSSDVLFRSILLASSVDVDTCTFCSGDRNSFMVACMHRRPT